MKQAACPWAWLRLFAAPDGGGLDFATAAVVYPALCFVSIMMVALIAVAHVAVVLIAGLRFIRSIVLPACEILVSITHRFITTAIHLMFAIPEILLGFVVCAADALACGPNTLCSTRDPVPVRPDASNTPSKSQVSDDLLRHSHHKASSVCLPLVRDAPEESSHNARSHSLIVITSPSPQSFAYTDRAWAERPIGLHLPRLKGHGGCRLTPLASPAITPHAGASRGRPGNPRVPLRLNIPRFNTVMMPRDPSAIEASGSPSPMGMTSNNNPYQTEGGRPSGMPRDPITTSTPHIEASGSPSAMGTSNNNPYQTEGGRPSGMPRDPITTSTPHIEASGSPSAMGTTSSDWRMRVLRVNAAVTATGARASVCMMEAGGGEESPICTRTVMSAAIAQATRVQCERELRAGLLKRLRAVERQAEEEARIAREDVQRVHAEMGAARRTPWLRASLVRGS